VWTSQFRLTEQTLYPYSTGRTCRVTNLLKKDFRITKSWEEPYQSDIKKIRIGQQALITGEPFSEELRGTVEEIGLQVSQQEIFNNQPGENLDQRVVKVRIRLNAASSDQVSGLTNLQVQVAIQP
ncbi:MAG: hypothetical protein KME15_27405, partial [Drouetiella hepatica Uher 2000/2452]|nr:hypothetical protein [Drouetiella hepatica Uher 2000/2452]